MRTLASFAIPTLWLAVTGLCQAAASPPQAPQSSQVPQSSKGVTGQGLTVVRDAETGELRAPTAAELKALQAQAGAPAAGQQQPTLVTGPDGRKSVYLGSSRLVYSVVRRGPDGSLDHQCVEGADGAHTHLNHGAPSGAQEKARHEHR